MGQTIFLSFQVNSSVQTCRIRMPELGWKGPSDAELKREAQMTTTELAVTRRRKK
jgi:hypothetical protein